MQTNQKEKEPMAHSGAQAQFCTKRVWDALNRGDFAEAEGIARACYADVGRDGEFLLGMFAAAVRSENLVKIHAGASITDATSDLAALPSFVRHLSLLEDAMRELSASSVRKTLYSYISDLIQKIVRQKNKATEDFLVENTEILSDFLLCLIPLTFTNMKKRASYLCEAGELFLANEAYSEARELFLAAVEADDSYQGRRGVLLATLHIREEKQLATCEHFNTDMPEYIDYAASLKQQKEKKRRLLALIEQNGRFKHEQNLKNKWSLRSLLHMPKGMLGAFFQGSLRLICFAFIVSIFIANDGWLFMRLVRLLPFIGTDAGYGVFFDIFSLFLLAAFIVNFITSLGLTTNTAVFLRAVFGFLFRTGKTQHHFPYTARKRVLLTAINLLLCQLVRFMGKVLAENAEYIDVPSIPLGIGLGLLAFFLVCALFSRTLMTLEETSVGARAEDKAEVRFSRFFGGFLSGMMLCSVGLYMLLNQPQMTGWGEIVIYVTVGLGVLLLLYGAIGKTVLYRRCRRFAASEDGAFSVVLLTYALSVAFKSIFFEYQFGENLGYISLLVVFGLLCLLTPLFGREMKTPASLLPMLLAVLMLCLVPAATDALSRFNFAVFDNPVTLLTPNYPDISAEFEISRLIQTFTLVFFIAQVFVSIGFPSFLCVLWTRILGIPLRIFRIKPECLWSSSRATFKHTTAKRLFLLTCTALFSVALWHVLPWPLRILGELSVSDAMICALAPAVCALITVIFTVLFLHLVYRLEEAATERYDRGDDGRIWVRGYYGSMISVFLIVIGAVQLLSQVTTHTILPFFDAFEDYFLVAGGTLLLVVGMCRRAHSQWDRRACISIMHIETGFGIFYTSLLVLLGVLGYVLGASPFFLVPIGVLLVNSVFGIIIGRYHYDTY